MRYPEIHTDAGRLVPTEMLQNAYLVWTMPERGLRFKDFVAVLNRFTENEGLGRVAKRDVKRLLKTIRNRGRSRGKIPYNMITGTYRVSDDEMKRRQLLVFKMGYRGTPLDKMERIRTREHEGVPYHRQDRKDPSGVTYDSFAFLDKLAALDKRAALD